MGNPEKPSSPPVEAAEGAIRAVSELALGSRIVYPNQGVCRVGEIQTKEIAGQRLDFVSMTREEDGATILVPVNKVPSIGLRHVADSVELGDVFDLLASSFDDPELDWKVRHRMHGDLMSAGGVLGVAEVLKALQALANLRPLPQKERERYDAARHLLVHEIAVALGVPEATAEDFIDLALIPPPGTVRPAAKPRRLATLPPKFLQKPVRPAARAAGDELDDEFALLDEEELPGLGLGEEGEEAGGEEEAPEEGAGEAAEAEGEEAEEKPKAKKAPAKKAAPKPKKAKAEPAAEAPAAEPTLESPVAATPAAKAEPVAALAAPAASPVIESPEEAAAPAELEPEEAPEVEAPKAKKAPARKAAKPAAEPDEEPRAAKAATGKAAEAEPKARKAPAREATAKKPAAAKEPAAKKAPAKKPAAKETPAKKPAATKPKAPAKKK